MKEWTGPKSRDPFDPVRPARQRPKSSLSTACGATLFRGIFTGEEITMTKANRTPEEWRAIFDAARPRGLCAADIAKEQGLTRLCVNAAAKRLGITLPDGRAYKRAPSGPAHRIGVVPLDRMPVHRDWHLINDPDKDEPLEELFKR